MYHAVHEANKAPKSYRIVLHDCIDGRQEVTHALHVPKVFVVLVVR